MSDQRVRIVQMLCPSRHCITATAYESPDGEPMPEITDRLRRQTEQLIEKGINPWCGICQAKEPTWNCEDRPTLYATMAEALPHLQLQSDRQATVREYLRASRS
jgi:hypothetical protein